MRGLRHTQSVSTSVSGRSLATAQVSLTQTDRGRARAQSATSCLQNQSSAKACQYDLPDRITVGRGWRTSTTDRQSAKLSAAAGFVNGVAIWPEKHLLCPLQTGCAAAIGSLGSGRRHGGGFWPIGLARAVCTTRGSGRELRTRCQACLAASRAAEHRRAAQAVRLGVESACSVRSRNAKMRGVKPSATGSTPMPKRGRRRMHGVGLRRCGNPVRLHLAGKVLLRAVSSCYRGVQRTVSASGRDTKRIAARVKKDPTYMSRSKSA